MVMVMVMAGYLVLKSLRCFFGDGVLCTVATAQQNSADAAAT
jgi:hypothetical protein